MKKIVYVVLGFMISAACFAGESVELSAERIKALISVVNDASNRMMMSGSTVSDVDALFSLYTDDFVYTHEVYGGDYSREQLYTNSVKSLK
ncbi:MAG: hypothetical protein ACOY3E_01045 [Pseudomonadota bacterium]